MFSWCEWSISLYLTWKTSETISDSAECYAGLSVRFESSAGCMQLVSSRPKHNLQLLFVKTVLNFTMVFYVEFRSF